MMNYTEEQKKAIEYDENNLLVSASAGSGKTAVLVERIIYLLENKNITLNNLAVMTFTRAAAAQMKDRLRNIIIEKAKEKDANPKWQSFLYELPNACITTIDSFCNNIVRDNFYKLNLDVDYRIMDVADEILLEQEVINELFDEEYEGDLNTEDENNKTECCKMLKKTLSDLSEYFDIGLTFDKLKKIIFQISHFCDSEAFEDEFLDKIIQFYGVKNASDMENTLICAEYAKYMNITIKDAAVYLYENAIFNITSQMAIKLIEMVKKFRIKMQDIKRKKSILSFADVEHFALKILVDRKNGISNKTDVASALENEIAYILVDEYQDSNYVQEEIINSISNGHNIFMVGDLKQSIYGFRQAKCEIFKNKQRDFFDENNEKGRLIFLSKNFRSDKRILDFINDIFKKIINENNYDMTYGKEELLLVGNSENPDENAISNIDDSAINVLLVAKSHTYEEGEYFDKHMAAAYAIGEKIKKIVDSKKYSYSDIAILARAKSGRISQYIKVFEELNIPYVTDGKNEFLEMIEVSTIVNFLRIIDNSSQDIPLAAVMLSYMGNFTAEELVKIRLASDSSLDFYISVKEYSSKIDSLYYDENLAKKIDDFYNLIDKFKAYSYCVSIYELLYMIIDRFDSFNYFEKIKGAENRIDNIRYFLNFADNYAKSNKASLAGFLNYLDKLYENDVSIDRKNSSTSNAVHLMTIHASKGLEFPVVFYCGLESKFNIRRDNVALNSRFGLGFDVIDVQNRFKISSVIRDLIDEINKKEQIEEEIRLMYVSLTRAKNELYLVFEGDLFKKIKKVMSVTNANFFEKLKPIKDDSKNYNSVMDYFLPILMEYNAEFFLNVLNILDANFSAELSNIGAGIIMNYDEKSSNNSAYVDYKKGVKFELCDKINIKNYKNEISNFEADSEISCENDNCIYVERKEKYSINYNNIDIDKPIKLSVSKYGKIRKNIEKKGSDIKFAINDAEDYIINIYKMGQMDGSNKGILYHKIFEVWDFGKEYNQILDIEKEIDIIIEKNLIKADDKKILNLKKIWKFVSGLLYNRMKVAYTHNLLFREKGFLCKLKANEVYENAGNQEIMIEGIVDAYFIENDSLVILDYKSDRSNKKSYYIDNYSNSLNLYARALSKAYNMKVKDLIIYSLEIGEINIL